MMASSYSSGCSPPKNTLLLFTQVLIPLAAWAGAPAASQRHRCHFILLSASGLYGLLPLLFRPQEYLIKILLTALYLLAATRALLLQQQQPLASRQTPGGAGCSTVVAVAGARPSPLTRLELAYLWGFAALKLYCALVHGAIFVDRLPFLPLMLTSVYCSLGVSWVWGCMAVSYALGSFKHGGY